MKYVFSTLFMLICSINLLSQSNDSLKTKDTNCYKLKFYPGDTLVYKVVSYDSIIVDYDKPLKRQRLEHIQIVCDSVNKLGRMFLTQQMISFAADEAYKDENSSRLSNPWLNRKVSIEIDSVGNRYSFRIKDSAKFSTTPGGVYVPYLFFPFKESCKYVNQSWSVKTTDELLENSIPPAILRQSSLFRAEESIDTLNYRVNKFRFIKTGQGSYDINTKDNKISSTVIINGAGNYFISELYNVPVYYFANLEQKLTINVNDKSQPGWHYLSTEFFLDKFVMSKKRFSKKTK